MKKIIFVITGFAMLLLNACNDEKMEWNDPYTHPAAEDLPLALQEQISRYEALTAYTNIRLGVGIDFNLYMTDEKYRTVVNENFKEITPGNEMKQQSLMKADGTLDFSKVDPVIEALHAAGLTVYGHTLVWHSQQRASYLNSLIAPSIIPGPAGESLIDGDFENGMGGFAPNFNAQDYEVVDNESLLGTHSLKVNIGSGAAGKYDAQLTSPTFPIINGHRYEISFFIKCSGEGKVGIDFPDGSLGNQYPWIAGTELASVGGAWTQVVVNPETTGAMLASADNSAYTFRLLLGAVPSVTYYIDNVIVLDLDATPAEVNYVENGDFETGEIAPWTTPNQGAGITVTADAKYEGSYGLKAVSGSSSANEWDLQFQTPGITLDPSKSYHVSFMVKSDVEGSARISYDGFTNNYPWTDWDGTGTTNLFSTSSVWKEISYDLGTDYTNAAMPVIKLSFDFGKLPNVTYFIDNVKLIEKPVASSVSRKKAPIIVDKTMEEKAAILEPVFKNYITDVASHFAGKIAAWDVVNEPMNENGTVRTGEEDLTSTSYFYWMYYLGKDYAVTAFKAARAADPAAKLFINDYNLESESGNKLDGLIEYVQYIESQGAVVDGIGTQVHLNISYADTSAIASMFQKLASTGKLIKISELDIAVNTDAPTVALYAEQSKLYEMIVRYYKKYIPEAQQYGITVWGVSDNAAEHEYWLNGDAPNLWDANYARKHAFKGFADGLAGKDVGAEFPGTLEY